MKYILPLVFHSLLFTNLIAQNWAPLGSGNNNTVQALYADDTLYVGGRFSAANGQSAKKIAKWVNGQWSTIGPGFDNPVRTIAKINGTLYIGGEFAYAKDSSVNCFAAWNGTNFSSFAGGFNKSGQHSVIPTVNSIIQYKNQLYAGGVFDYANYNTDYMQNVAMWNGSKWQDVGGGIAGTSGISSMVVYHNTLYVGGEFINAGSIVAKNIAKWDGNSWTAVAGGMNNAVTCLTVLNDTLYAGGIFTQAGGNNISYLAKLNGNTWEAVGSAINGGVAALCADSNTSTLYVGGTFTQAGGNNISNIAQWKNSTWSGLGDANATVRSLAIYNNKLYAGGDFTTIGGANASRIAIMNTNIGLNYILENNINIYPNPTSNYIYIETKSGDNFEHITIYDLLGRTLISQPFSSLIDVHNLHSANYILVLVSKNNSFKKMIEITHE